MVVSVPWDVYNRRNIETKRILVMNTSKVFHYFVRFLFGTVVLSVLAIFVLFLMKVSFQPGTVSGAETNMISTFMAERILDTPTADQIAVVNRLLRYAAHLSLFFILSFMLTYVCFFMFRGFLRFLGMGGVVFIACFLSYYTEYKKQFIDGRHFDMADVRLNIIGCLAGIACMLFSYVINSFLYKKNRHYE